MLQNTATLTAYLLFFARLYHRHADDVRVSFREAPRQRDPADSLLGKYSDRIGNISAGDDAPPPPPPLLLSVADQRHELFVFLCLRSFSRFDSHAARKVVLLALAALLRSDNPAVIARVLLNADVRHLQLRAAADAGGAPLDTFTAECVFTYAPRGDEGGDGGGRGLLDLAVDAVRDERRRAAVWRDQAAAAATARGETSVDVAAAAAAAAAAHSFRSIAATLNATPAHRVGSITRSAFDNRYSPLSLLSHTSHFIPSFLFLARRAAPSPLPGDTRRGAHQRPRRLRLDGARRVPRSQRRRCRRR
jgi:hypothetical protein